MDKISKALKKFSQKEREWVREVLMSLQRGELSGLNIQKLKGHESIYRIRKGDIRIIVSHAAGVFSVLTIERRSEKTYRDY